MSNSPLYESSASENEDDRSIGIQQNVEAMPTPNQAYSTPHPTKKNKPTHHHSPTWDIEEQQGPQQPPKDAPPVIISNVREREIANRAQVGRKLLFGSIDEDTDSTYTSSNPPANMQPSPVIEKREKRQTKPSQKALYMQGEAHHHCERERVADNDSTKKDMTPVKGQAQAKAGKGKEKTKETTTHDEHPHISQAAVTPSQIPRSVQKPLPPNLVSQVKIQVHQKDEEEYINKLEDMEEHELGMRWVDDPNASICTTSTPQGHALVQSQHEEQEPQSTQPAPPQTKNSIPANPEMKYEPCLLEAFQTITRDARDRGGKLLNESSLPAFAPVYLNLKDNSNNPFGARNLRRFYAFTGNKVAFNPARATEAKAGVQKESNNSNGGWIVQAGSGSNMLATSLLFFSSGLVASCNLVHPATTGSVGYTHNIKRIRTQRDGIVATHRGSLSAQTSPKKPTASGVFAKRSPVKIAGTPVPSLNNPPFLKYSEDVPIYDTRSVNFQITPETITDIHKLLPRYNGGLVDLSRDSIITVAYMVNAYPYTQAPAERGEAPRLCLSFNIQFVLYHGRLQIDSVGEVLAEEE